MKTADKSKLRIIWVLIGILGVQILGIAYFNLFKSADYIDCDGAMLYVHAIEMWRNKTFLIPEWQYITTGEIDCSLLFVVPIFGMTGNIFVSFGISNLIFICILIWTMFLLFKGEEFIYPILSLNVMLIPYGIGQLAYFNMLFFNGGQYIMKVLLPLMLIAILRYLERGFSITIKEYFFAALYFIFLVLSSFSSGIYVFACGIFPVLACYVIWKFYKKERVSLKAWVCVGVTLVGTIAGFLANIIIGVGSKGNAMALCGIHEVFDNIVACVLGIFEVFGGIAYDTTPIMSLHGINTLVRLFFVLFVLGVGYWNFKKVKQGKASMETALLLSVFCWNLFILFVSKTRYGSPTYEYRYHIIGLLPLLCLTAVACGNLLLQENGIPRLLKAAALFSVLVFLNATSFRNAWNSEAGNEDLQQICDFANEQNSENVYFLNDSTPSEICRLLDYQGINYLTVNQGTGVVFSYDYYMKYAQCDMEIEDSLIVAHVDLAGDWQDIVDLFGYNYARIATIGEYYIYRPVF